MANYRIFIIQTEKKTTEFKGLRKRKKKQSQSFYLKEITVLKITVFYFNSYKEVIKTCKLWDEESKDIKGNKLHHFTVLFLKRIARY